MFDMRRREFITLLGGAASSWPLAARAQQRDRMRRLGVFSFFGLGPQSLMAALVYELERLGWRDGRNIDIEYRFARGTSHTALQVTARELVKSLPDLIFGGSTPVVAALQHETGTIPIVFVSVSDPVGSGFVYNLANPGGNITGFTDIESSIAGKCLGLLKEIAPHVTQVALIFNPDAAPGGGSYFWVPFEASAPLFAVKPIALPVHSAVEMEATVGELGRRSGSGLIVMSDLFLADNQDVIIGLASRHRLPAIYSTSHYAKRGGLAAYGVETIDLYRRAAAYIDRILKGEKPANLPVQNPVKFELVINLKTAKALDLTVPPTLLARADGVIE